ncbi:hypothetical protein HYPSUDRAFT_649054 [Hypholoma sublateritium FD-334 SS-4]|uniref:F-box domain-containing protein n=1 Tax=Hypholoma sublateritium (strain FD-334 SS-4) TaxID=945553 RepID=A0A0D2N159_HYPSF|nr:hypothetical protein HYPSUDRAFT_649054 [Hypholoma sublateritium FD-334 SS-4]
MPAAVPYAPYAPAEHAMSILDLPATTDDILLDCLPPSDILRYSRTCRYANTVVKSYMKRAFNLNKLLSRFFSPTEIQRFRELQCSTGMLISGSIALQFFERVLYPDSDLDLYIEHRFSRQVADWLVNIGYNYAPLPGQDNPQSLDEAFHRNPHNQTHIPRIAVLLKDIIFSVQKDYVTSPFVFNFEKQNPYRKIQLISSLLSPLQRILGFHSTCVMNIITHDKAYSFYPRATFDEHYSLVCRPDVEVDTLKKYKARGWSMFDLSDFPPLRVDMYSTFSLGRRYVGDPCCWTIPINSGLNLPHGYVESNSWVIKLRYRFGEEKVITKFDVLATRRLKFSYIVDTADLNMENEIRKFIGRSQQTPNPQSARYLDEIVFRCMNKLRAESEYERLDTESEREIEYSDESESES